MEEQNQHIDQYFRENLGGYTEQPDASVWDALEKRLDEKPRKRGFFWIWPLGFLVAAGLTMFVYNASHHLTPAIATGANNTVAATSKAFSNTTTSPAPAVANNNTASPLISQTRQTPDPVKATAQQKQPINLLAKRTATRDEEPAENATPPKEETEQQMPLGHENPVPEKHNDANAALPSPAKKPDYLDLQPVAGKLKNKETIAPDPEAYYSLTPSAGKQTGKKAPVQQAQGKSLADTAAPQQSATAQNTIAKTEAPPQPVLNSGNTAPAVAANNNTPILQDMKNDTLHKPAVAVATDTANNSNKKNIHRFSAGIKAGYETGAAAYKAGKMVISPYLQYHFTPRLSLMVQPAAKYAKYNSVELFKTSYHTIIDSSIRPVPRGRIVITGGDDRLIYKERYDSIVVTRSIPAAYKWEFDIPLLLNYKLFHNLEIFGGPHINIAGVVKSNETSDTYSFDKTDTVLLMHGAMSIRYDTPAVSAIFPHTDAPYSTYTPFNNPNINPFRMGITFGASYIFKQRLTLDVVYLQNITGLNAITDEKQKQAYRQPYIRMTLGYRFIK